MMTPIGSGGRVISRGVGEDVAVSVGVCCGVAVSVKVFVGVALGSGVKEFVGIGEGVAVAVATGTGVAVKVGVGVGRGAGTKGVLLSNCMSRVKRETRMRKISDMALWEDHRGRTSALEERRVAGSSHCSVNLNRVNDESEQSALNTA